MSLKSMLDLRDRQARFLERRSSAFAKRSEKATPLKARRRRARLMAVTIIVLVTATVAFTISWLSHHERFVINRVEVEGAHEITPQSVQEYVMNHIDDSAWRYISQKNIFFYDRQGVESGLAHDMLRIKSVKLSKPSKFSQSLIVSIEERRPAALWCHSSGACYRMDDSGFIFDGASSFTVTSYTFDGGVATTTPPIGQTFAGGRMQEILALLERLRKAGFAAGGISVDSDNDYRAHLVKGYDLKISFGTNPNKLTRDLQLVLASDALEGHESNLAYIDLRFGNRVYFRMKDGGAAQQPRQ
jgi:cell division septal protein FtsQ